MVHKRKVGSYFLFAIIALFGVVLYLRNPDRGEIEEKPEQGPTIQEEASEPAEETESREVEAEEEPGQVEAEEDFRVKIGREGFSVILEDGHYENLDKVKLNWTLNNLFEHIYEFEIIRSSSPEFLINGREVETRLYLRNIGIGRYGPNILGSYQRIIEKDGVYHLLLSREFIEEFIEASKYAEITDELNEFIEQINRIRSTDIENLTEAQIDSLIYVDPTTRYEFDLEEKKEDLREFLTGLHFLQSNVFWTGESGELAKILDGIHEDRTILGKAIYFMREDADTLSSRLLDERRNYDLPPPSNFDPRLHMDPDASLFIWIPAGTWPFIYHNRQWKIALIMPGT